MSLESTGSMLEHALSYLGRGWCIIPIRHRPGTDGKQPAIAWTEFQKRRPTEAELRRWFGNGHKHDGLAVILGEVSGGLVCRDLDKPGAYERWAGEHPQLAKTLPTVQTSRGWHVYFRSKTQVFHNLGDGELRGDSKHYCLLPPSCHPSGAVYHWIVPLSGGELPVIDPVAAGLSDEAECAEPTECAESMEGTEGIEGTDEGEEAEKSNSSLGDNGIGLSALSVSSNTGNTLAELVECAIAATLPTATGKRNRAVFELARALKGISALADAPFASLREYVEWWHARALAVIGTKPFDDTWADFVVAWPAVRFPRGQNPVDMAMDRAGRNPAPAVARKYEAPETRRLISICRELQRPSGEAPFFLSAETAGRLVNLDRVTAWRRLRMLEADGVLTATQRGHEHRATRYRYTGGD